MTSLRVLRFGILFLAVVASSFLGSELAGAAQERPSAETAVQSQSILVHRRYIEIAVDAEAPERQLTILVNGEAVEKLAARVASPERSSEVISLDASAWQGGTLQIVSDSGSAELLSASMTQSNALATDGAPKQPVATLDSLHEGETLRYAFDIEPILSENCFACHGPNADNEHSDLRLSDQESAVDYGAIEPGNAADSEVIARIVSDDPDLVMPPPESHKKPLTPEQVDILRRWIDSGAEYEKSWAFQKPKATPPHVQPTASFPIRNAIDAFALAKLREAGLEPNAPEEPHRLIRRVAFDLTGLPPRPEHVERYTKNPTDETYAAIVDELLASHHYGEHWARHWLDAVRYADTHGIHNDNYRSIWPYRDWVVDAFNQNMPFDQFSLEQIAGDMLPDATRSQRVATGYNRCLPTTSEGGSIVEEVEVSYANDRTATTFAVWQGLTVGCAACHDHKFDPVSQKEYYQLTAYFRNNTMKAMDGNYARHAPTLQVPSPEQEIALSELRSRQRKLTQDIKRREAAWQQLLEQTTEDYRYDSLHEARFGSEIASPTTAILHADLHHDQSGESDEASARRETSTGPYGEVIAVTASEAWQHDLDLPIDAGRGFGIASFVKAVPNTQGVIWSKRYSEGGPAGAGFEVLLRKDHLLVRLINQQGRGFTYRASKDITDEKWHHLAISYNPSSLVSPLSIHLDGTPINYSLQGFPADTLPADSSLTTDAPLVVGRRAKKKSGGEEGIRDGAAYVADLRVYDRPLTGGEVHQILSARLPAKDAPARVREWLLNACFERFEMPRLHASRVALKNIATELDRLNREIPVTLVLQEKSEGQPVAHILDRGDYAARGEKVSAGVPSVLPELGEHAPNNRLGLASWIVSPENPLTARVTANRYWSYLFGTGIVETTEDFGVSGARPTHPELLNWLADDFVTHDWDLHHLLRRIVMSSTYRQSARADSEKLSSDPNNRLFSRGPRRRLDGEQLRDMALLSADLLVDRVGGPPVRPYQPAGVWKEVAMPSSNTSRYRVGSGEELFRRSLYTFWKRTAAPPSMTLLNAPNRDVFCVRREQTNTPLQALVLLNDPQFVEAARHVAQRVMVAESDFDDRCQELGSLFLARTVSGTEIELLRETFDAALQHFAADPKAAAAYLSVGQTKSDKSLPTDQLAAWTLVVNQVMNLDETLTK